VFLSVTIWLTFSSFKYFIIHQCRDLNCYYKVWIMSKNCDRRISKRLCDFDVSQKNSQEPPEDGVNKHRNNKFALIVGYGRVTWNAMQGVHNVKIKNEFRCSKSVDVGRSWYRIRKVAILTASKQREGVFFYFHRLSVIRKQITLFAGS